MAQADYDIAANPSGLNMRTEINTIFQAILSTNSGSSAPTVTTSFMMWVDTSNATYYYLKMRNHDNTAWVTLFVYTVATKVITAFIVNSPTTNAIPKINADGTIGNSNIINDINGNTGFGVTPSSSATNYKSLELGGNANAIYGYNGNSVGINIVSNAKVVGTQWQYVNSSYATRFDNSDTQTGNFKWFTAPSGIAGNAITWINAMTLDASGDLIVPHTYLNTTASAANMFIDSAGKFFRSTSSKQYKTDIENIDNYYVESFFNNARPIYYKSLSTNDNPNWGYWGFIAEEIAEFDKRLVHWRYQTKEIEVEKERVVHAQEEIKGEDGNIIQESKTETIEKYIEKEIVNDESKPMIAEGVMYERITVLLTSKVQEQQKTIDDLLLRIKALENK